MQNNPPYGGKNKVLDKTKKMCYAERPPYGGKNKVCSFC